ncbi:MAG: hypothetical protein CMH61_02625 [Nanoarchaeota archaeon]|nr:hypothetical protein [Nanoarchaeota archaeon]|tara:strand:- start:2597 stop:2989 length:393 start_codon:yes stop_codon:yes gene_type:complete
MTYEERLTKSIEETREYFHQELRVVHDLNWERKDGTLEALIETLPTRMRILVQHQTNHFVHDEAEHGQGREEVVQDEYLTRVSAEAESLAGMYENEHRLGTFLIPENSHLRLQEIMTTLKDDLKAGKLDY